MNAVKALGANRVGEYGVLWGDESAKDITGEYFTAQTDELKAIFEAMGRVPALFHHAMDDHAKSSVVGYIDVMQPDDTGLWVEAQLERNSKYTEGIRKLVAEGKLHWSSGTLPGARKVAGDGRILRWPIVELSLTPSPAEYRMLERPVTDIKAAYKAIGLELEASGTGAEDARRARLRLLDLLEFEANLTGAMR